MSYKEANSKLDSSLQPDNRCIAKKTAIDNGAESSPLSIFEDNRLVPANKVNKKQESGGGGSSSYDITEGQKLVFVTNVHGQHNPLYVVKVTLSNGKSYTINVNSNSAGETDLTNPDSTYFKKMAFGFSNTARYRGVSLTLQNCEGLTIDDYYMYEEDPELGDAWVLKKYDADYGYVFVENQLFIP